MTPFAFVFPGQGSQTVGMLSAWGDHPVVRETLRIASEVLGEDLGQRIAQGPQEALDLTTTTQPVMLAAGVACWRAWMAETGLQPAVVAGHSLGEYTALVAAGALRFEDALPLVRLRAQAMQQAVAPGVGAMAAILGLEAILVQEICAEVAAQSAEVVEAVNFNDPKQTVIAGTQAGVTHACEALKARGAKRALLLAVSAPFHSSLMQPAALVLKARLAEVAFQAPSIPLINNIDVASPTDANALRDALYRQAFGPVRWTQTIAAMQARGITHIVECGPGRVLAGMCRRIDPALVGLSVSDPATLQATQGALA
jgi:[acyl-carrier-protein] S-malonyltransferase